MARHIPEEIVPISISLYSPPGFSGIELSLLAPSKEILSAYKKNPDIDAYTVAYNKQLGAMSPDDVYNILYKFTCGRDCVLLCYEKTGSFCHRNLVALWMNKSGYNVQEWIKT